MQQSRTKNSLINFIYGSFSQVGGLVLSFVVRTVFVYFLDIKYLGLNGLFSSVLSLLSLAELGFGVAMVHALYKPLADNNQEKLTAYMQFYKKVYSIIGVVVAGLGLVLIPFLGFFIKGEVPADVNIYTLYLLFLSESVLSYYFAYKRSILNADQKSYICSSIHLWALFFRSIFQILSLILWKNFIIYIICQIVFTFLENLFISRKVDKLYPYLAIKKKVRLLPEELNVIKKNVYALVLSRVAAISLKGSTNIIISAFVGLAIVGVYSNYVLIIGAVSMVLSQVFSAMTGSVGNFFAKEERSKHVLLFERLDFLNFLLYGSTSILLFLFLNPVIRVWLGEEYVLGKSVVLIIVLNFLLEGLLYTLWLCRTTLGLFTQGKYRPVWAALINIIVSLILASKYGLIGVLLGCTVSRVLVNVWYDPYIIYKEGLKSSVLPYYKRYIKRFLLLIVISLVSFVGLSNFNLSNLSGLLLVLFVYSFLLIIILFFFFRKNSHFIFYKNVICDVVLKFSRNNCV